LNPTLAPVPHGCGMVFPVNIGEVLGPNISDSQKIISWSERKGVVVFLVVGESRLGFSVDL